MLTIKKITALEILDSRGNPTIATTVTLTTGIKATAGVPSGASTGRHEALELRDKGKRYQGKGVTKAVNNVNKILNNKLKNRKFKDVIDLDYELCAIDGSKNKSNLGANAILGVSMAFARAAAYEDKKLLYKYLQNVYSFPKKINFPFPMMNVLNGGRHADNGLSVQEFMIVPKLATFSERLRAGSEIYHTLKNILNKSNLNTGLGDEGGFAPRLKNNEQALKLLVKAIKLAGYQPGKNIFLAIDVAASEFFNGQRYKFENKFCLGKDLISLYKKWIKKYPLILVEDGLSEDDWGNWQLQSKKISNKILQVGDDLFVTNYERLQKGIELGVANSILIKLNQIGTVSETISAIKLAQKNDYKVIISHRSGETSDDFIADLALASGAEYIKSGAPARAERVAKYNRLVRLEKKLN